MELPIEALPVLIREAGEEIARNGFTCTCPAAQTDGQHQVLLCGVTKDWFTVRGNPAAVLMWCAGDYTDCPVWIASHDEPDLVQATIDAAVQSANFKITGKQIASGLRVDDREEKELEKSVQERAERFDVPEDVIADADEHMAEVEDDLRDGLGRPK